jgi:ribosomal protein S18 acetylase RimI-like enzyme
MALRTLHVPADLVPVADMIVESFQYPENPAWSVQTDEKEQLVNGIRNVARIWPLMRLMGWLSPSMRDIFRGHIWQEDGQIVGATILQRRGSTDVWVVGTVGVLPAYRRRGIARKLLAASLEFMRERGATQAVLGVIDGNLPAYKLYEDLGFEHYSAMIEFEAQIDEPGPASALPQGYHQKPLSPHDWQPRYELEKRICPESTQRYDPVTEGRYRRPLGMRLLYPILMLAQAMRDGDFAIYADRDGQLVARGGHTIPTRGQGVNNLRARLDPAHADLAPYLMGTLIRDVMTLGPGHRIDFMVPEWMDALVAAAEAHGLQRRMRYLLMGIEL